MTGPFDWQESGDDVWIMDANGFCIARMKLRIRGRISEFTSDEVRSQAMFIVNAMNAASRS